MVYLALGALVCSLPSTTEAQSPCDGFSRRCDGLHLAPCASPRGGVSRLRKLGTFFFGNKEAARFFFFLHSTKTKIASGHGRSLRLCTFGRKENVLSSIGCHSSKSKLRHRLQEGMKATWAIWSAAPWGGENSSKVPIETKCAPPTPTRSTSRQRGSQLCLLPDGCLLHILLSNPSKIQNDIIFKRKKKS